MRDGSAKMMGGADIRARLSEIGAELAGQGRVAEIALYGGSAMLLMFEDRKATRDVDFVPVSCDTAGLIAVAERVGARHDMPPGWFNDAVAMFKSDWPDHQHFGDFPPDAPGLRVFVASPRYILAMKLLAMRSAVESKDMEDIWGLVDECGVTDLDGAMSLLAQFYPGEEPPHHKKLVLQDLFEAKQAGKAYDPMLFW